VSGILPSIVRTAECRGLGTICPQESGVGSVKVRRSFLYRVGAFCRWQKQRRSASRDLQALANRASRHSHRHARICPQESGVGSVKVRRSFLYRVGAFCRWQKQCRSPSRDLPVRCDDLSCIRRCRECIVTLLAKAEAVRFANRFSQRAAISDCIR